MRVNLTVSPEMYPGITAALAEAWGREEQYILECALFGARWHALRYAEEMKAEARAEHEQAWLDGEFARIKA